jgi:CRISPR-associated protein Cas2
VIWKITRRFSGSEVLAMMVLITYDVSVTTDTGKARLRKVAKQCVNYGQRVQNSVFECLVDPAQFAELKHRLESIIDHETDSLRYYFLGNNWRNRVEHAGAKAGYDVDGVLVM